MHHEFNWTPTIGDPTFVGWLTVVLYFVTAWRSAVLVRSMYRDSAVSPREFFAWAIITVLFILLGINKQLDLQSALTELGRVLFYRSDRIGYKQTLQFWFIIFVAVAAAIVAAVIVALIWKTHVGTWIGCIGTVIILGFVFIRAASFHHVDVFIHSRIFALKWNWILEIGGILIVLYGTFVRSRVPDRRSAALGEAS
jgi:hypothetical protein